jgi:pyridoxal phosphate enzyme (YggS family)
VSEAAEIAAQLRALHARIAAAAARAGRAPEEITLVGVSKQVPAARVAEAVVAGLAHVGENYVNEARAKLPEISAALDRRGVAWPRWHFVGRLQRNKAKLVAAAFDCLHSLVRPELGDALERHLLDAGRRLDALVQVNVAGEEQKGGVAPSELPALLEASARWQALRVTGLMTVPPADADPRPHFAALRRLRDQLGAPLRELSMGMSGDFEVAIEEGATIIRIGTAIFGARAAQPPAGGAA